jgi:hypothetical protein
MLSGFSFFPLFYCGVLNATRNGADYEDHVVIVLDRVTGLNIFTRKREKVAWSHPGFGRLLSSTSSNPPLHDFYRFFEDLTACKLVAIDLDRPISYIFFQVPTNFFFVVMATGRELGH